MEKKPQQIFMVANTPLPQEFLLLVISHSAWFEQHTLAPNRLLS